MEKDIVTEKDILKDTKIQVGKKILNIVLWIVLFMWMGICITDYVLVKNNKNPMFCVMSKTVKYVDGDVTSCTGALYKVYKYDRDSFKGIEFAPVWGKDKSVK